MSGKVGPYLFELAARLHGRQAPDDVQEERETLLARVEALLIFRASFEYKLKRGPISPAEDAEMWTKRMNGEAVELLRQAGFLFPDLIGRSAFELVFPGTVEGYSAANLRDGLASRLRYFRKLLAMPDWASPLALLTTEIEDMNGGDDPVALKPEPRNPGQAKQPTRVARMRLHALCWNVHLKTKGVSATERQATISGAYKAAWDSIRKWRNGCEAAFGTRMVVDYLAYAANGHWGEYDDDAWQPKLKSDGADYYEAWQAQRG